MQRFALIHDGSTQGWQSVYLAFHIAARLGAPLLVLMADSSMDKKSLVQEATQVRVGGRAANVTIRTHLIENYSAQFVAKYTGQSDGIFIPQSLVPNTETARQYLLALSCPIWVVVQDARAHIGVLVNDWESDKNLIALAKMFYRRLQIPFKVLTTEAQLSVIPESENNLLCEQLPSFSLDSVAKALDLYHIDILFIPASNVSLIEGLNSNYVLFPVL